MNKNALARFAALVTATLFAACSSDNSASPEVAPLARNPEVANSVVSDYGQVKMGKCLGSLDEEMVLAKKVSEYAVIYPNGNGKYEIMLPTVMDYCAVYAPVITRMAGDTLMIAYDISGNFAVTGCSCVSDHYFDVDKRFIGAKFAKFEERMFEVRFVENPGVLGGFD